jgi:spermidine synthase
MNDRLEEAAEGVVGVGRREVWVLLLTTLVIATNGIIYELLIAGYSSYLLGDSIYQFSLTIGLYLSAMGVGSYLTRRVMTKLLETFVWVEVLIALCGGLSVFVLSIAYTFTRNYQLVMFAVTILIGLFIGLEIPLVTRIIAGHGTLRQVIANVLSYDYVGALVGSLAFPLFLLPTLGFLRTGLVIGLVNAAVALVNLFVFRRSLSRAWPLWVGTCVVSAGLVAGLFFASALERRSDRERAGGELVLVRQSPYQRIVVHKKDGHYGLALNGFPQFSTRDEHRYHEALVHPPMVLAPSRENVLILGGGDGLALREIWKYPDVREVTMVDLDPMMTDLARTHPLFVDWNKNSMNDPRLRVRNEDAWKFLEEDTRLYDVIVVDLPDPTNIALSKLYAVEFYRMLRARLAKGGMISIQSGEIAPFRRKPYWCIARTVEAAGLRIQPYAIFVPSFGHYVWTLASNQAFDAARAKVSAPTRYLSSETLAASLRFDPDLVDREVEVNTIDTHVLLKYFFTQL